MRRFHSVAWLVFVVPAWLVGAEASGAGRVELEVAADRYAPPVAQQTWVRELGEAGVRHVRIRQQRSNDRPGITVRGTKDSPIYLVTALLDSHGQLVLPGGGRYRSGEARRIAAWLDDLARHGPPDSREPLVAFGLTRSQMAAVLADLAGPIGVSTHNRPRADVVRKIVHRLKLPVHVEEKLLPTDEDDRVEEELAGVACGTGLAAVLRGAGLALVPRMGTTGPEYVITAARGRREVWPIGWKPEKRVTKVLPKLFEPLTIGLENVPASEALRAIAKRLETPVLVDHAALARHGVDPDKRVNVPKGRTTYDQALARALFQARMKYELRADEAGRPLLWVTTLKR